MKKVLFVVPALNHGGVNKCLLHLLSKLNRDDYCFKVLPICFVGPYKDFFNKEDLLPEDSLLSSIMLWENLKKEKGFKFLKHLFFKLWYKAFIRSDEKLFEIASKKYCNKYDTVIAFQEAATTKLGAKIASDTHIAWVHCDYSNYMKYLNNKDEFEVYDRYDRIVCVSEYTAQVFRNHYPALSDRTFAVHNLIDTDSIINMSKEAIHDDKYTDSPFTMVSVGRMDPVKRFSRIPEIAKFIKEQGLDFKWYIIGGAGANPSEYNLVLKNIEEFNLRQEVVLLGSKDNPYPYMAKADAIVCPSYSEACPNVVNEAKILHVPVIAADFPSAPEFIENGVNGIIIPIEQMGESIVRAIKDEDFYNTLSDGIKPFEYDNTQIMSQIHDLLSASK